MNEKAATSLTSSIFCLDGVGGGGERQCGQTLKCRLSSSRADETVDAATTAAATAATAATAAAAAFTSRRKYTAFENDWETAMAGVTAMDLFGLGQTHRERHR